MLSIEALSDLEEEVLNRFPEQITGILSRCNRNGELEKLLKILQMEDLLEPEKRFESYKEGKIVVIGGTKVNENVLLSIAKDLGLSKDRFEFCLDYEAAQKYDFRKMQYAPSYRLILFGPVPHSGHGKGDSGSIIAEIENHPEMYPRAERLLAGQELKITKSSFREKLQQMLQEDYI